MATAAEIAASLDDLYRVKGKAELVDGRVVHLMAAGRRPNRVALRICRSVDDYAEATGVGETYTDNIGFAVPTLSSGRQSFSPDVSFFLGPFPSNPMRFLHGAPAFAVEVRSENDDGPRAEAELAAKRADYFEAGTLVVWDVDPVANRIQKFTAKSPDQPEVFSPGQEADAEPAVAGWRVAVDGIFA